MESKLYEFPSVTKVDGLPPAPSFEKGRDRTFRGVAQPILQF